MDPVTDAIAASNLRGLSTEQIADLTADARRVPVPAGTTYRHVGEDGAHLELVLSGFIRAFVAAPDGRMLTIRYARPGAVVGTVSLFAPGYSMPGSVQALVDSEVLAFRPDAVRALAARDPAVAGALLVELSVRVRSFVNEITGSAFSTVRQRVGRHLLDLASDRQHDRALVATVTQQQLADAVGSVREVVVRVLRELREEGLVRTSSNAIEILDPERLLIDQRIATGEGWNQGS
jgi:CRP/FNR family transcriptional regulator